MKRFLVLLFVIFIPIGIAGCSADTTSEYREEVKINLPKDNTVNGYRLDESEKSDSNTITADRVTVENKNSSIPKNVSDSKKPSDTLDIQYCANINSRVFHKTTCGSAKNIKEENKYISNSRNELISDGYTPCEKCNP